MLPTVPGRSIFPIFQLVVRIEGIPDDSAARDPDFPTQTKLNLRPLDGGDRSDGKPERDLASFRVEEEEVHDPVSALVGHPVDVKRRHPDETEKPGRAPDLTVAGLVGMVGVDVAELKKDIAFR
jgi:hypothetical protein